MLKTEKLAVKVLPTHKLAVERLAKAEGEPVAVIIRRLIRAEAERCGVWTDPAPPTGGEEVQE